MPSTVTCSCSRTAEETASKFCTGIGTDSRSGAKRLEEGTSAMPFTGVGGEQRQEFLSAVHEPLYMPAACCASGVDVMLTP